MGSNAGLWSEIRINLKYIPRTNSYCTVNTLPLDYTYQSVNAVYRETRILNKVSKD
jgi:hypothetical protein